jgi:S-adenosylmethionine:tRNA ribosyltransferase-isomerase
MSAQPLTVERREAHEPPEVRGAGRGDVAMLVAARHDGRITQARFGDLPQFLAAGDLLVVNTSATLPAALSAQLGDRTVELRLSTPSAAGTWVIELRTETGLQLRRPPMGARLELPGGAHAVLLAPFAGSDRLAVARLELAGPLEAYLRRHGHPIRYGYVPEPWPLSAYQTVFAREPGRAEMPSAGRPFTTELVTDLVTRGVGVVPITLHTGVSSPEAGEPPQPERYAVAETTARAVNMTRAWGGRVVAVGTTVTRALESAADAHGIVRARRGWTDLVLGPRRSATVVNGLITGWHAPGASHLDLLEAVAGADLVERAYAEALRARYLWHEFGDSCLLLP